MALERRFLVAKSFARILERALPDRQFLVEGYLGCEAQGHFVRVGPDRAWLMLGSAGEESPPDAVEVPKAHAEALLDLTPGVIRFVRVALPRCSARGFLDRLHAPNRADLVTLLFADEDELARFEPWRWLRSRDY
jgi:hypothetical protein